MQPKPLWQPSLKQISSTNLEIFREHVNKQHAKKLKNYNDLHHWSTENPGLFWQSLWHFCQVIGEMGPTAMSSGLYKMPGTRFFPEGRLNFAENLLRRQDQETAILYWSEDQIKTRLSYKKLYDRVVCLANVLKDYGVKPGDRVAAFIPNIPEAIIGVLAAASIGAVWSSCSPDFGSAGVVDRFSQIEPKVLLCADGYFYQGKTFDSLSKVQEFLPQLPTIEKIVVFSNTYTYTNLNHIPNAALFTDLEKKYFGATLVFERFPFNHPLYILFSSGTTGKPKCIIHGAGGTLLQHLKEHRLHSNLGKNDRLFYYTTCGWMMWNWMVSALASEASLLLYDGSPFHPKADILFDFISQYECTHFGTSAKYIDACSKANLKPSSTHHFPKLRMVLSTGSPLSPDGFKYVYQDIKNDVCLASISGGTDIVSCFVLGNPTAPVFEGEIQTAGLGMKVEIWNDLGQKVIGEKGELVCTAPFPSMPIGFWNDPDNQKYRQTYFDRFPNVWCHGDYAEETKHGGFIIYGRSDAVLKPGGVRIGTAEIYRQVEKCPEVQESIAIGQDWQNDVRVVLFVRLKQPFNLNEALQQKIRQIIRQNASPRHVPAKIIQVADIPRTRSGKIVELAVRDIVAGRTISNKEALANPEALELFRNLPELKT
ncbi:MAG TPA: acetoacetate--CoA ligase [Alphaproteobacteria bacterium]|nr:acetoacetate--CoA ligase [Alphaproteobacteria bacterium]